MNKKYTSWGIFVLLCFIWGSSFKLMRDSSVDLSAAQIASLRIFSAGLVFLPFAFYHFSKIPRSKFGIVILSAVCGNLFPAFLFAIALTKIDGSLGGILNSLTPIFVVVVGILFYKSKIKSQKIIGVVIGFMGLVLLTIYPVLMGEKSMRFDNIGYTLLIVVGTFLYGINVNMVYYHLKEINPIHIATVSISCMLIPTGIVLWQQDFLFLDFNNRGIQNAIWMSAGLGIVGSAFATALFYMLVQRAGGLFASLVTYGIPFIALFWGFIDGEKITWIEFICLGIILLGVYLANRPEKGIVKPAEK